MPPYLVQVSQYFVVIIKIKSLHDEARRNKRLMAQRNSFRMSANYDNIGFTQEQLLMLQEKDQSISDLQFSLDERTAELEDVSNQYVRLIINTVY